MKAESLLLGAAEIRRALGPNATLEPRRVDGAIAGAGKVIAAAASDAAYQSFAGRLEQNGDSRQIRVGEMVLLFDTRDVAERTYASVAEAAHLRTKVGDCSVAVETVTAPTGLVSYWGFIQRGGAIVVLTLDTLDPQVVSMTSFRALVTLASERMETVLR